MQDVNELRDEIGALGLGAFLARHPSPVILARQLLAGELRRREPITRQRLPTPVVREEHTVQTRVAMGAESIWAGTMAHVKPSRPPGRELEPGAPGDRELSGQRYAPLRTAADAPAGTPVTIGRDAGCDVVLDDFTVSARHAHFLTSADGHGFALVDTASTNGTWVGGRKLVPGRPHPIRSGERLVLGRLVLRFLTAQGFYRILSAPRSGRHRA